MTQTEALRLALEALSTSMYPQPRQLNAIAAIKAALEAKDEPWEKFCDSNCVWTDHHPDCKLAQRTWVGLTAEERDQVQAESYGKVPHHVALIAAVEAKLKEKNT